MDTILNTPIAFVLATLVVFLVLRRERTGKRQMIRCDPKFESRAVRVERLVEETQPEISIDDIPPVDYDALSQAEILPLVAFEPQKRLDQKPDQLEAVPPAVLDRPRHPNRQQQRYTIFLEVAWCQNTNRVAWALYARTNGDMINKAGVDTVARATGRKAAVNGMAKAMQYIGKHLDVQKGDIVLFQSGNETVLDALRQRQNPATDAFEEKAKKDADAVASSTGMVIQTRHISQPGGNLANRKKALGYCKAAANLALKNEGQGSAFSPADQATLTEECWF